MNLEDTLRELGIKKIFSEKANFKQLTDDPISVSNLVHRVSFRVSVISFIANINISKMSAVLSIFYSRLNAFAGE